MGQFLVCPCSLKPSVRTPLFMLAPIATLPLVALNYTRARSHPAFVYAFAHDARKLPFYKPSQMLLRVHTPALHTRRRTWLGYRTSSLVVTLPCLPPQEASHLGPPPHLPSALPVCHAALFNVPNVA